jgi:hypothetical protein
MPERRVERSASAMLAVGLLTAHGEERLCPSVGNRAGQGASFGKHIAKRSCRWAQTFHLSTRA